MYLLHPAGRSKIDRLAVDVARERRRKLVAHAFRTYPNQLTKAVSMRASFQLSALRTIFASM